MRIIIAGGRSYNPNFDEFCLCVSNIIRKYKNLGYDTKRESLEIISGRANGADKLGERYAEKYNLKLKTFPAHWDLQGKSAGHIRNECMGVYASQDPENLLIAFWDKESKGTKSMLGVAKRNGIPAEIVEY